MYERLITSSINFIYKYGNIKEEDREVCAYGIELLIMNVVNSGIILVLSLIVGKFVETLILLVAFAFLQSFTGGYHAQTHTRCLLSMIVGWAVTMLYIPLLMGNKVLIFILAIFGLSAVFLLAPVKHKNYPMSDKKEKEMRIKGRFFASIFSIFSLVAIIFFPNAIMFAAVLSAALFSSAISMTYALIKQHTGA